MKEKNVGKLFRYADAKEQTLAINKFMCISTAALNVVSFAIVFVSYLRGYRSIAYTFGLLGLMLITSVGSLIIYLRNKESEKLRYFVAIGLFFITALLAYGFNSYYMRVMSVIPFMGAVLYYDVKFARLTGFVVAVENFAITLCREFLEGSYKAEQFMDNLTISVVILVLMFVIWFVTRVGRNFNVDSLGKAAHEAEVQAEMMGDVLEIAEMVRAGTVDAMGIINQLRSSSESVNYAVGDISASTGITAENIQTQSVMTQSIQENIQQTVTRAENMVQVAKRSSELNDDNAKRMELLREETKVLAETNDTVSTSMKQLQENVENVKAITKTIFDISSQTNLLALNASIESARAGEAGRGFAVVAEEIRSLSERTRQETENIARILDDLAANAGQTAAAVERSVEVGNTQEEMIAGVAQQFDEISENVSTLVSDINEIGRMLDDLSKANTEIVNNITSLSATTEEVTASAQQSSELTEENFRNTQDAKDILDGVLEVSHRMDKYIS